MKYLVYGLVSLIAFVLVLMGINSRAEADVPHTTDATQTNTPACEWWQRCSTDTNNAFDGNTDPAVDQWSPGIGPFVGGDGDGGGGDGS